jgi:hypothetical protein
MIVLTRLVEQNRLTAGLGKAPPETRARQPHRLFPDRAAYDPDSAPPQKSRRIQHARRIPPERTDKGRLGDLPRSERGQPRDSTGNEVFPTLRSQVGRGRALSSLVG